MKNNIVMLKILFMVSICNVTNLFAIDVELELGKIKLPARSVDLIYDYVSLDSGFNNVIESYEISIDTSSNTSMYSIQKHDSVEANELLLDEPRFSEFNYNVLDISVIKNGTSFVAFLGFDSRLSEYI
ncbi:MAG: hypothetical protein AB8B80_09175 [Marinicellaceae bacterium]